jgi:3-hydroxyisobutyrate dehydrogenase-like beta-hydroxyacid dehydrogenase
MRIGFIGLGRMGSGMATNLVKAGHEVTVYNRTPGKVQALVEHGAHAALRWPTLAEAMLLSPCWRMTLRSKASCSVLRASSPVSARAQFTFR